MFLLQGSCPAELRQASPEEPPEGGAGMAVTDAFLRFDKNPGALPGGFDEGEAAAREEGADLASQRLPNRHGEALLLENLLPAQEVLGIIHK
jgi:hypothetical protein